MGWSLKGWLWLLAACLNFGLFFFFSCNDALMLVPVKLKTAPIELPSWPPCDHASPSCPRGLPSRLSTTTQLLPVPMGSSVHGAVEPTMWGLLGLATPACPRLPAWADSASWVGLLTREHLCRSACCCPAPAAVAHPGTGRMWGVPGNQTSGGQGPPGHCLGPAWPAQGGLISSSGRQRTLAEPGPCSSHPDRLRLPFLARRGCNPAQARARASSRPRCPRLPGNWRAPAVGPAWPPRTPCLEGPRAQPGPPSPRWRALAPSPPPWGQNSALGRDPGCPFLCRLAGPCCTGLLAATSGSEPWVLRGHFAVREPPEATGQPH